MRAILIGIGVIVVLAGAGLIVLLARADAIQAEQQERRIELDHAFPE